VRLEYYGVKSRSCASLIIRFCSPLHWSMKKLSPEVQRVLWVHSIANLHREHIKNSMRSDSNVAISRPDFIELFKHWSQPTLIIEHKKMSSSRSSGAIRNGRTCMDESNCNYSIAGWPTIMKARSSFFTYNMLIPSNDKVTRKLLVWIKIGVKSALQIAMPLQVCFSDIL
jgi:hypothetical protein